MSTIGIAGLTDEQASAVEAATLFADPVRHDGLIQAVANALGGSGPWDNPAVTAAIGASLRDFSGASIPTAILFGV
jgi:hypothetical protein